LGRTQQTEHHQEKGMKHPHSGNGGCDAAGTQSTSEVGLESPIEPPRLPLLDLHELIALTIEPREMVLDPIIPAKALAMLYGLRGSGKTHVAFGIACAVAGGASFLTWQAPKPRRVVLVDGETPAATLRERLQCAAANADIAPGMLKVLAGDLADNGMRNLGSAAVQAELESALEGVDLVILDNLSSLSEPFHDDAIGWKPIEDWLLRLRRRGHSVLIVHHAGRNGAQRGTSRREDLLDTSISLQLPFDYTPTQGARFEIHIEKARGIIGKAAKPFEARLEIADGKTVWSMRAIEDAQGPRVAELLNAGFSIRAIAADLGLSKSTVFRLKQKMVERPAADNASRRASATADRRERLSALPQASARG
jgi:putative DNA primase/helicase